MLHRSFKPAKCKTSLKLATSRIKLMKNKKENHLKQLKRELAQLLESGQDQTARIRVEHVVREEKTLAAYDLLDIYCELIAARLPIIESQKNCPIDMKEAVTSVIFACPRCADIPELQDVRKHFTAKYGKEFATAALELRPECGVSRMQSRFSYHENSAKKHNQKQLNSLFDDLCRMFQLVEKLSANAPDGQTKLKILAAIAEEHNVEWDPKSFGQKETKPYDDLLNGPNAFGKMYPEPPIVQAPPPPHADHAPRGHDQKHDAPVNYQQNLHSSMSSHNFASPDLSDSQSRIPAAPHSQVRPSGFESECTELRHTHSRDENSLSSIGQNWNMEFKDATEAAQAAAESAERASMAARAAAELSSQGKITRQHSTESHKSNIDVQRDDKPRRSEDSASEKNLSQHRNQNPHLQREQIVGYGRNNHYDDDERFRKDYYGTAKRSGQSDSSKSETATMNDKMSMDNFREQDRYSRKSSFEEGSVQSKRSASAYEMSGSEQASGQELNRYSRSSSSSEGHDSTSPSHQKYTLDDRKDLFDPGNSHRESGNIGSTDVVFDSYSSDDDEIHLDKQPFSDDQERKFFSASLTREPSNCLPVNVEGSSQLNTSGPSEKHFSASHVSAQWFSPPDFDDTPEKAAPTSAQIDDLGPATFDDSSDHSSGSEDDFEKSNSRGKADPDIPRYTENNLIRDSDDIDVDHGFKGSFDKGDSGSGGKQNLLYSSDEREHNDFAFQNKQNEGFGSRSQTNSLISSNDATRCLSPQSSRLASVNKEQDTVDVYTSSGSAGTTMRSEGLFDNPESQNGKELNFGTLTGGLRNKRYKIPPYAKIQMGDSSSSKGAADDMLTFTQNPPAVYEVGPEVKENSSTRSRVKNHDLGTDNLEEEIPGKNLQSKKESYVMKENSSSKTRTENYDLGTDDSSDKHRQQKLWDKQEPSVAKERKEVYTKSKFSAPVTYFDLDDDDFEEHLPKQTTANKVRGGSAFSRRTKGNVTTERSSYSKVKHGSTSSVNSVSSSDQKKQDNSKNITEPRPKSGKTSTPRPGPEEIQKSSAVEQPSSPLKTAATSTSETSRTPSGEAPSRDSSLKKASHVHPKLPDYDSIAAQLQAIRQNRR